MIKTTYRTRVRTFSGLRKAALGSAFSIAFVLGPRFQQGNAYGESATSEISDSTQGHPELRKTRTVFQSGLVSDGTGNLSFHDHEMLGFRVQHLNINFQWLFFWSEPVALTLGYGARGVASTAGNAKEKGPSRFHLETFGPVGEVIVLPRLNWNGVLGYNYGTTGYLMYQRYGSGKKETSGVQYKEIYTQVHWRFYGSWQGFVGLGRYQWHTPDLGLTETEGKGTGWMIGFRGTTW